MPTGMDFGFKILAKPALGRLLGRLVGLLGLLVDILRHLVGVLKKYLLHSCATRVPMAGAQGPPIRILFDFPDHYKDL